MVAVAVLQSANSVLLQSMNAVPAGSKLVTTTLCAVVVAATGYYSLNLGNHVVSNVNNGLAPVDIDDVRYSCCGCCC